MLTADNPTLWGYELVQTHSSGFVKTMIKPVTEDAFHLHLIGKVESLNPLEKPPLLKGDQAVVVAHENVDYPDFYRTISTIVSCIRGDPLVPEAHVRMSFYLHSRVVDTTTTAPLPRYPPRL